MRRNVYFMILIFTITNVIVLLQTEQFITFSYASPQQKENVIITALVQRLGEENMVKALLDDAINKTRSDHPDLAINLNYTELHDLSPAATKDQMLNALSNGTNIDIISLDQIWLGEFAQKGLLTDLTNYTEGWGRISDLYESNLDGGVYNDTIYGIWYETDVRGTWYWKDLLNQSNVDPDTLKTWDGYIAAAKNLNTVLRPHGIEGVHLTGASHSPDVWYPYLWMLGGAILESKPGHPTKDFYWYPSYNSSEGVKALAFINDQVEAGVKPQKIPEGIGEMDLKFANRKFAVMIEGSWMPGAWSNLTREQVDNIGFIPMFPVPDNKTSTSTLMGGWQFNIPVTSLHKDIAWEIIENLLEPEVLSPWLADQRFLPTQITLGQGTDPYADHLRESIPFYDDMISMIPDGRGRPNIPEYQTIAEHVRQALDEVYYGIKEPKQALDDAAAKSAEVLGW